MGKKKKPGAPGGLQISREGAKFKFAWNAVSKAKDYDLQYRVNGGGISNIRPEHKKNKRWKGTSFEVDLNNATTKVEFRVRAGNDKGYSGWTEWKGYDITVPDKPSVNAEVDTSSGDNKTKFSWSFTGTGSGDAQWYLNHQYKKEVLFEDKTYINDGTVGNQTGSSGSYEYVSTFDVGAQSFCQRVTVQGFGKRGSGPENYAEHVYGIPDAPTGVYFESASITPAGYVSFHLKWTQNASYWHPIDYAEMQYCLSPPAAGMKAPKNLSGQESGKVTTGTEKTKAFTNGLSRVIDHAMTDNECLFARVRVVYDNKDNFSQWVKATSLNYRLSNPSITDRTELSGNMYTVTVNNTARENVPDSFIAISYKSVSSNNVQKDAGIIGIIRNDNQSGEADVRIPDLIDLNNGIGPNIVAFGAQAIAYAHDKYFPLTVTASTFEILREDILVREFELTEDIDVDENKTYYTRTQGTDTYIYTPVLSPVKSQLGNYYELTGYRELSGSEGFLSEEEYFTLFQVTVETSEDDQVYKHYTLEDLNSKFSMVSDQIWESGEVPKPPANFNVVSIDDKTAEASWSWSWGSASYVELAWSEESDAWESTDEPTLYRVRKNKATSWRIKGLSVGTTWYLRARFIVINDDGGETEGPWSKKVELNLTSAPTVPELKLSKNIVTANQDFVASWTYTSSDGSPQDLAEIFIVTIDDYGTRVGTYRRAIDVLEIDENYEFDPTLDYYEYINGGYTKVASPDSEDLLDYFMFDSETCIAKTEQGSSTQQLTLNAYDMNLQVGQRYYFAIRLKSQKGVMSEFSPKVQLEVVEPLEPPVIPPMVQFQPETVTEEVYDESGEYLYDLTYTYFSLKSLPLEFTVTGAGENGTVMVTIERATDFFAETPDESSIGGYAGEIVALIRSRQGEGTITITHNDLSGNLDDGAAYRFSITIIDENGQTATSDHMVATVTNETFSTLRPILYTKINNDYILLNSNAEYDSSETYYFDSVFVVDWDHQPEKPEAYVLTSDVSIVSGKQYYTRRTVDADYEYPDYEFDPVENPVVADISEYYETRVTIDQEHLAAIIKTDIPSNYATGDYLEIYRLSADRPQLIVPHGEFGTTYVDPYPAFGEFGGHRIVHKTINGDYLNEYKQHTWVDTDYEVGDVVNTPYTVINFEQGSLEVLYNIDVSSTWKKDFKETRYLGGHIQGDWNPGVSRTGSINTVSVTTKDQDTIQTMRRLADYSGIVHIRSRDGSSYAANVDVTENMSHDKYELATYSLNITRVDSQTYDGLTLTEWTRMINNMEG